MTDIPTPKISEILNEEFMQPFNLSAYTLARRIGVPTSRIQAILHDRRKITVDTSVRLGRFFGVSDRYFLNLQNDVDIRNAKNKRGETYNQIERLQLN
ncbi:HigA family addiction module antitoxin [Levilactobacillus bambusae]|uniref:Addiction module antidote protein, HigA family n=1 Tax=Levilactobacillus bambusae TaxID=2024736 RepID=A0A2V1MY26_9LACO|nr:HigA family addiction module antitoxin [Levilactobacillus bambusae]PWF99731.1 addiction module antidote protein, HigA family [Levilactobacillus bambusae]